MAETQDKILEAIKTGCSTRKEIIEKTGFTWAQVHNSLKRLRKWGLVISDNRGWYGISSEKK